MRGVTMERFASQVQDLAGMPDARSNLKTKCVLVAIYENNGKTILQPLIGEQEDQTISELFQNKTLEVWLSNGKPNMAQFDVAILKYKQVLQSLKTCNKVKNSSVFEESF